ncbi:MAG: hypothetical protein KIS81_04000 [Maricaulaceae bacterium]|nr:hypothetical protein [Maricaulaceae bacterium]
MTRIDDDIRAALEAEDAELFEKYSREPGMFEQIFATFRTRMGGWMLLLMPLMLAVFAAGVYGAWRFIHAPELRDMLLWGGLAWICFTGAWITKLWFYMQVDKYALIREIKRLELQVARLASKQAL